MKKILLLSMATFLFLAVYLTSCTRANDSSNCASSCNTSVGYIKFNDGCDNTEYNYNCYVSGGYVDANHYSASFNSCNNPGCNATIILGYFASLPAIPPMVTLSSSSSTGPNVELSTNCPSSTSASTITPGTLVATVTTYSSAMVEGTIAGTINGCAISNGSFMFSISGSSQNVNCSPYYIKASVNGGSTFDMACGGLTVNINNVATYAFATPTSTANLASAGLVLEEYNVMAGLAPSFTLPGNNPACSITFTLATGGTAGATTSYISPGATTSGLVQLTFNVTDYNISGGTISGTFTGNCVQGTPIGTSVPVSGSFYIPIP